MVLSSADVYNHGSAYGEIKLSCSVHLRKGVRDPDNQLFLQQVCALLNSGGGLVSMQNADVCKDVLPRHLDLWWSGMENIIARIMSTDDIVNFVDFVGNFDDEYLYLFVKSAESLCTIEYYCRLPTDTATHEVYYKSAVRLCQRQGCHGSLEHLPAIPTSYEYGRTEETLKQEGKQIQFKLVTSRKDDGGKSLALKVSHYSSKYICAFANHEGGHIYFGIEDGTAEVYGETLGLADEREIVDGLERKIKSMIWSDTKFVPQRGIHWDIRFLPVFYNAAVYMDGRAVIVVSVCKFIGGVFAACPESYIIAEQPTLNEQRFTVQRACFDEWKKLLLNQARDCPSLQSRFVKLPLLTPQCRLTFSLPQTLQSAREKTIKLKTGFNFHPRNILHCMDNAPLRNVIMQLLGVFAEEAHLSFALDMWGLSYLYTTARPEGVLICLVIFSMSSGIHVVSFFKEKTERDAWAYASEMAVNLKQCLVNHGGCNTHLGIRTHILDIDSPNIPEAFQNSVEFNPYPQTYCIRKETMDQILDALTIAIASYKPFGNVMSSSDDTDHYFLLTSDQLELLWTNQCTKDLWIHGPPGAGKTVAALEMVKEFRRRGNMKNQVLYVAENSLICSYVQSFDVCLVVSRRDLMDDAMDPTLLKSKYSQVKNVVVDEAQNFKSRDGDWYGLLEKMSQQNVDDGRQFDMTAGYFWLFMDYAQKVHKFEAGLPGLIGNNNFMLSEISRNSKEIFEYASKFMAMKSPTTDTGCGGTDVPACGQAMQVEPVLGHQFSSGQAVSVVKCDKSSMHDVLFRVLKQFSDDGVEFDDMAILVSKKKDTEPVKHSIKNTDLSGSVKNKVPELSFAGNESSLIAGFDSSNNAAIATSSSEALLPSGGNLEVSDNCFTPPDTSTAQHQNAHGQLSDDACMANNMPSQSVPLLGTITTGNNSASKSDKVHVSTVREFSGLDKSVIVGMDPYTNPDHADLEKLILNMATRARDSLVILTTSDNMMEVLEPPM